MTPTRLLAFPIILTFFVSATPAIAQGPPAITWQGTHSGYAYAVAFSPDGQFVASGSADRTAKLWRASDGTLLRTLVQCSGVGCRGPASVAFSPDGRLLASAGSNIRLWDVATGTVVRTINMGLASVRFSPDGQTLIGTGGTGYNNVFVKVIRVADGTTIRTLVGGGVATAYSPDGSLIGAVGRRGFDLWNAATGQTIRHLDGTRTALAFSPAGDLLALAGNGMGDYRYDDTITFFRVEDGAPIRTLKRTGSVSSMVFTADGQTLVSGSWDPNESPVSGFLDSTGAVRFWNVADGSVRVTYDRETGTSANSPALSPDGQHFGYTHDSTVVVAQYPDTACAITLDPDRMVIPAEGGSGSFAVLAPDTCHWTAAGRVDWIHVTGGASGTGPGTVTFTVDPPSLGFTDGAYNSIVGQIIAGGQSFLVDFGGEGDGCYYALQPDHATFAMSGGDASLFVFSPSGCAWRASSDVPWIHPSTEIHVGDGGVGYHVDPNESSLGSRGTQRTGVFRVGDSPFTVTQESSGCSYALAPTTQSMPAGGGQLSFQVTAASGCQWTAVSNAAWIHVTGGSPGSGNGTVYYYVDYNNSLDPRSGTVSVGGLTFTVNQAGVTCDLTISPASRTFTAAGGSAFVNVMVNDICTWTATSGASWVTVTNANGVPSDPWHGTGQGTVYYRVAANTGPGRTGTIAIGGQVFTVIQGAQDTEGAPDITWMHAGHSGAVNAIAVSPDGQLVASGGADGVVKLWRREDGSLLATLTGHFDAVNGVAFSPDGHVLASVSHDLSIKLWDTTTYALVRNMGSTEFVLSVAFSPDGQKLATGGGYPDNALKYWRLSDGQNVGIYMDHAGQVNAVEYAPGGQWLASGRFNGTIRLENLVDYHQNTEIYTGDYGVTALAYSADGQLLVSGSDSGQNVRVWRAPAGPLLRTLVGPSGFVHAVDVHPDGDTILSGGQGFGPGHGTVLLWRASDGALLHTYTGETALSVNAVRFTPDGTAFAYGRSDGTVVLARTP